MNTPTDPIDDGAAAECCVVRRTLTRGLCRSLDWLEPRTGWRAGVGWLADRSGPSRNPWQSLWISSIVFTFVVQAITGFCLWIYYSPSAQTAWESVYYLQYEVAGGWLLRGVHHYAAQVLVALSVLYVLSIVFSGSYRAPRECVYWGAVLMVLFALGLCLTGDLLAWDQNSYAASLVRTKFLMLLPMVGDDLFKLVAGGPAFGHLTLTRFFALHIGLFASGFLLLLVLHGWLLRRAASMEDNPPPPESRCRLAPVAQHTVAWLAVMIVVGLLATRHAFFGDHHGRPPGDYLGVGLGAPADPDPASFYAAARPEWSFRGLYQLSNMFPGDEIPLVGVSWKVMPIFKIPGLLLLLILLVPFIGRWKAGYWINASLLGFLLVYLVLLSAASWGHDFGDPEYGAAVADGSVQAERVKQLARSPQGIPVGGALSLLRNDPKTQGPKIFEKQCAMCHVPGGSQDENATEETPTAPRLCGFASRDWLADFLDPDRIKSLDYYGNTRFASGVMVRYVEGPFSELKDGEKTAIVAALSAEAQLPSQRGLDRQDKDSIDAGRQLIGNHCARCHCFDEHGSVGFAPDLTGYGSREWTLGIVIDPTHSWLYGERNDRMPAYLEVPERPADNRLSAEQVGMVVDWLRGQWYEPPVEGQSAGPEDTETAAPAPTMLVAGKWAARAAPPAAAPDGPAARARGLFEQEHCSVCHDYTGMAGGDLVAGDPSAPDLGTFASREWIAGLLDPEQIKTRKYFGNSKFRRGDMAGFVDETFEELDDDEKEEIESLVMAVSTEAGLPSQREIDQRDADRIEEGRELIAVWGCTDCHRFGDEGDHVGPDLTGYGSAEWIGQFISDPADEDTGVRRTLWFYGDENYGMPSYRRFRPEDIAGESPEEVDMEKQLADKERLNLLSAEEVEALVGLLRGELAEGEE